MIPKKKKKKKKKDTVSALKPAQAGNKSEEIKYTMCPKYKLEFREQEVERYLNEWHHC